MSVGQVLAGQAAVRITADDIQLRRGLARATGFFRAWTRQLSQIWRTIRWPLAAAGIGGAALVGRGEPARLSARQEAALQNVANMLMTIRNTLVVIASQIAVAFQPLVDFVANAFRGLNQLFSNVERQLYSIQQLLIALGILIWTVAGGWRTILGIITRVWAVMAAINKAGERITAIYRTRKFGVLKDTALSNVNEQLTYVTEALNKLSKYPIFSARWKVAFYKIAGEVYALLALATERISTFYHSMPIIFRAAYGSVKRELRDIWNSVRTIILAQIAWWRNVIKTVAAYMTLDNVLKSIRATLLVIQALVLHPVESLKKAWAVVAAILAFILYWLIKPLKVVIAAIVALVAALGVKLTLIILAIAAIIVLILYLTGALGKLWQWIKGIGAAFIDILKWFGRVLFGIPFDETDIQQEPRWQRDAFGTFNAAVAGRIVGERGADIYGVLTDINGTLGRVHDELVGIHRTLIDNAPVFA